MGILLTKYQLFEILNNRKPTLPEWMEWASDPKVDIMLEQRKNEK